MAKQRQCQSDNDVVTALVAFWREEGLTDHLDINVGEWVCSFLFAMSGKSETSTLFTFKCRIGLAESFPVILRIIVQTFFIEVRLLILDTNYGSITDF